MTDKTIKAELEQFDADERENLEFFELAGTSETNVKTVKGIIADERLHVASGEQTAMQAEDNVDDRADIALDPDNDDNGIEDTVQSIEAEERAMEQQLYGSER